MRMAGWLAGWLAGWPIRIDNRLDGVMILLAWPPVMVDGIDAPPLQMDGIWSLVEYSRVSECIFGSRRRRRTRGGVFW